MELNMDAITRTWELVQAFNLASTLGLHTQTILFDHLEFLC